MFLQKYAKNKNKTWTSVKTEVEILLEPGNLGVLFFFFVSAYGILMHAPSLKHSKNKK